MAQQDAFQSLLTECGLAIGPLRNVKTPAQAQAFFRQLGYNIPPGAFGSALAGLASQAGELVTAVRKLSAASGEVAVAAAIANLLTRIGTTVDAIAHLHDQLKASGAENLPHFNDFPRRLTDFLILDYLDRQRPQLHEILHLLGLIDHEPKPAPGMSTRLINWERFGQFLTAPSQIADDVYQWNSNFDTEKFFTRLEHVMRAAALPGGLYPQTATTQAALGNPATNLLELRVPIFQKGFTPESYGQFGLTFSPAAATAGKKPGIALLPYLMGATVFDFTVCDRGELLFQATGDIKGVGVVIRPPFNAEGILNLTSAFRAAVQIHEKPTVSDEMILIGSSGGTRLAVQGLGITWFVEQAQGKVDLGFEAEIKALRLVITGGEGDGFLQKILASLHVEVEAGLSLGMTLLKGFTVSGGAKLALELPVHLELGPIKIESLRLVLALADDTISLEVGVIFKFDLGPLQALIENIGLRVDLHLRQGNLGPADLAVGFKPPNGVGLSLDVGVIKGGGYLYFDFEREEYAGALELVFTGTITLKAIGLITTRMPDGSKGFSLLIIITAEFGTGIQLGYGFTLLAVGGLLGLNRAMNLKALMDGVQTGSVNSIMFPDNVVENAPRIISDLRKIFPPQEGKFLIGPMAKIGWGTPALISISLGLIIEIPGNVAIVGVLKVALPTEESALLVLQVNFAGAIEFDKKRLYFIAALFESRVLFITLEGGMGLLVAFGDDANFVLSVGGFHPRYKVPQLPFDKPKRLTFNILNESWARIQIKGYFAVTSNSVQFGAKAEVVFDLEVCGIEGYIRFDALFQFSPFFFSTSVSASFALYVFGFDVLSIGLSFTLEGPTPWRARGTGYLKLLFIEISVDFDETWGKKRRITADPIEVMPLLEAEFAKPANWQALLPASSTLLVSLRKLEAEIDTLVLHPVGTLRISQRAVPLDLTLDKVGHRRVQDAKRVTVKVSSAGLSKINDVDESFALAQFQELSESAKLTLPAFEPQHGGLELSVAGTQLTASKMVKRLVRYEEIVIDTNFKRYVRPKNIYNGQLFAHFLKGASASKSPLSQAQQKQLQPFAQKIQVQPDHYVVAYNHNNTAYGVGSTAFRSEAAAREFMHRESANDANLAESLHVIPAFELNG